MKLRGAPRDDPESRDRGDIGLLELITKDPQVFILQQGWASVSLEGGRVVSTRWENAWTRLHGDVMPMGHEQIPPRRASVGRMTIDASKAPETAAQLEEFQKAQGAFGSALQRLLVVAERYPDLKASAGFRDLQAQLEGTENSIAVERGRFNDVTRDYNTGIRRFPAMLLAGMLGFHPKPYFQAESGAEKPPEVNFDFGDKSGGDR